MLQPLGGDVKYISAWLWQRTGSACGSATKQLVEMMPDAKLYDGLAVRISYFGIENLWGANLYK